MSKFLKGLFSKSQCFICNDNTRKHCSVCEKSVCVKCRSVYFCLACLPACLLAGGNGRAFVVPCTTTANHEFLAFLGVPNNMPLLTVFTTTQKKELSLGLSGVVCAAILKNNGTARSTKPQKAGRCVATKAVIGDLFLTRRAGVK